MCITLHGKKLINIVYQLTWDTTPIHVYQHTWDTTPIHVYQLTWDTPPIHVYHLTWDAEVLHEHCPPRRISRLWTQLGQQGPQPWAITVFSALTHEQGGIAAFVTLPSWRGRQAGHVTDVDHVTGRAEETLAGVCTDVGLTHRGRSWSRRQSDQMIHRVFPHHPSTKVAPGQVKHSSQMIDRVFPHHLSSVYWDGLCSRKQSYQTIDRVFSKHQSCLLRWSRVKKIFLSNDWSGIPTPLVYW